MSRTRELPTTVTVTASFLSFAGLLDHTIPQFNSHHLLYFSYLTTPKSKHKDKSKKSSLPPPLSTSSHLGNPNEVVN